MKEIQSSTLALRCAVACDVAIEGLLIALLAFMPFAFGVVEPWSESLVILVVGIISLLLAVRAVASPIGFRIVSWPMLPVILFLIIAALQLFPLPQTLIKAMSPNTLATKTRLLGDLPDAGQFLSHLSLTFYRSATEHDLRIVLTCTVVFIAATQVFRQRTQIIRILWVIALIGGAAGILALLQDVSEAKEIYWSISTPRELADSGPFVGYSNYSQFINLCVGAAIGLLLYRLKEEPPTMVRGGRSISRRSRSSAGDGWNFDTLKKWPAWVLIVIIAVGCITMIVSLSRGGIVSLLFASVMIVLLLARRRGMQNAAWFLLLVLLVVFAGLLFVGFDKACTKMATLKTSTDPSAGRFQTYKDIIVAWRQFPLLGLGLGTHEYVYPMFDRSSDPGLSVYADSDYFQMLEEMGSVGVVLVLAFASFVWVAYAKAIRAGRSRIHVVAYGLGFGLAAVMLQSMVDSGQHLPAIGCISAVFCAVLLNLGRFSAPSHYMAGEVDAPSGSTTTAPAAGRPWPLASVAMTILFLAAMGWAALGAERSRRSAAALVGTETLASDLEEAHWKGADSKTALLNANASAAVSADPRNVKARYKLASYRWCEIEPLLGGSPENDAGRLEGLIDELNAARVECPTYGPVYALQGQIEALYLGKQVGIDHVETAYALAPADSRVCMTAAQIDMAQGKFDEAIPKARRAIKLDGTLLPQFFDRYLRRLDRPEDLVAAVKDHAQALLDVYFELQKENKRSPRPTISAAMTVAHDLLIADADNYDASADWLYHLAVALNAANDRTHAISAFQRAVQLNYGMSAWHFELAKALAAAGDNAGAIREAEISLHLQSNLTAARDLILEINKLPKVTATQ